MAKIVITGLKELQRVLAAIPGRAQVGAAFMLQTEGERIMDKSTQIVPVDIGALRDSGFVELPQLGPSKVSIEFGYGTVYAPIVHENPRSGKTGGVSPQGQRYRSWAQHGEWKFLERPLMEAEAGMARRMAARLWREIARGAFR